MSAKRAPSVGLRIAGNKRRTESAKMTKVLAILRIAGSEGVDPQQLSDVSLLALLEGCAPKQIRRPLASTKNFHLISQEYVTQSGIANVLIHATWSSILALLRRPTSENDRVGQDWPREGQFTGLPLRSSTAGHVVAQDDRRIRYPALCLSCTENRNTAPTYIS